MKYKAEASIELSVSLADVWDTLINPEKIKQYFFGVEVTTDWQEGSSISYKGEWNGTPFEDKGHVLKIIPEKALHCDYWSSMAGVEDTPENYQGVHYDLEPLDNSIKLTITQTDIPTEEQQKHSAQNWQVVLESLKSFLEK